MVFKDKKLDDIIRSLGKPRPKYVQMTKSIQNKIKQVQDTINQHYTQFKYNINSDIKEIKKFDFKNYLFKEKSKLTKNEKQKPIISSVNKVIFNVGFKPNEYINAKKENKFLAELITDKYIELRDAYKKISIHKLSPNALQEMPTTLQNITRETLNDLSGIIDPENNIVLDTKKATYKYAKELGWYHFEKNPQNGLPTIKGVDMLQKWYAQKEKEFPEIIKIYTKTQK